MGKVLQIHSDRPSVRMLETSSSPVEQNPPSEAKPSSASQENLRILLNPESLLRHSQKLATMPYRKLDQIIHAPISRLDDTFSHLHLGLASGRFLAGLSTKMMHVHLVNKRRMLADPFLLDLISRIIRTNGGVECV